MSSGILSHFGIENWKYLCCFHLLKLPLVPFLFLPICTYLFLTRGIESIEKVIFPFPIYFPPFIECPTGANSIVWIYVYIRIHFASPSSHKSKWKIEKDWFWEIWTEIDINLRKRKLKCSWSTFTIHFYHKLSIFLGANLVKLLDGITELHTYLYNISYFNLLIPFHSHFGPVENFMILCQVVWLWVVRLRENAEKMEKSECCFILHTRQVINILKRIKNV